MNTIFDHSHPLAEVAGRICQHPRRRIACRACWQQAITADAAFAAECELPAAQAPDPTYIDEIAVEIACRGTRRVYLTRTERAEAIRRLMAQGMTMWAISARLGLAARDARALATVHHLRPATTTARILAVAA